MQRILIELGQNIALLLSAALVYGTAVPRLARLAERRRGLLLGMFLGAVAWAGMFLPVNIVQGVHIDGRVVLVSVAAFVGGLPAALVAPVLPVAYRIELGGVGTMPGVAALLGGAVVGLLLHRRWNRLRRSSLYLALGLLVSAQALLWTFALPWDVALEALSLYLVPVLVTYTSGTVLLSTLLAQQDERQLAVARLQQEIARKEESERSLRESEARFRALAEHIEDVFWIWDRTGDSLLYVSPAYLEVWGRPSEELRRNPNAWIESIDDRYRAGVVQRFEDESATGDFDEEFPIRRADGQTRWIRERVFPVRDAEDQTILLVGVAEDITDRKQAEAALRMQQERLSAIVEHTVDGLCVARDGRIVLVNPAFLKVLGSQTAPIGRPMLDWVSPAARDTVERLGREAGSSAATIVQGASEGGARSLEVRVARYGTDSQYTLLIVRDVTEQLELEERLRQAQKMEAIGQLAGGIAHDFNNLLTAIGGHRELMNLQLGPTSPAADSLAEIGKAVDRAKRLVQQILAFSRKQASRRQSTDLGRIVDDVLLLLRATIPPRVELVKTVEPNVSPVMADASQLHQVLLNLCTNAWHALEEQPGRGRIEIRLGNAPGPDHSREKMVRLSVVDTGAGMTPEVARRMFEPFYTTKSPERGTGLGLSVVHGIVEAHHGTVEVDTGPGRGTAIHILLPAAVERPVERRNSSPAPALHGEGERVLYLDDERPLVKLATQVLTRLGYQVAGFVDPDEALRAFASEPETFDLVVTDLNMPSMSGLEFAEKVRALRPEVPMLITSGYLTDDVRARAEALGRCELIPKPSTIDVLSKTVHRMVTPEPTLRPA